jgi:hypothetical protein
MNNQKKIKQQSMWFLTTTLLSMFLFFIFIFTRTTMSIIGTFWFLMLSIIYLIQRESMIIREEIRELGGKNE